MGNVANGQQQSDDSVPQSQQVVPNHLVHDDVPRKDHPNGRYPSNRVKTTKYTLLSFIPKNLFEQFHRFANLYFVFIVLLNWVPQVNAIGKEIAMIPVISVLMVTAIKDAFEDYRRYKSDKQINNLSCRTYCRSEKRYVQTAWKDVHVGDIVHLSCNEVIPADLVLLHTSDVQGMCHIDTSNLDGENNLKQREIVKELYQGSEFHPTLFKHNIECELPNMSIYKFHGAIITECEEKIPVNNKNLLLRGCIIRNTDYVEGIVVYAGHHTKALLNNRGPRHKRSKLERKINSEIMWCILILFLMCFSCSVGSGLWQAIYTSENKTEIPFIPYENDMEWSPAYQGFIRFWTYVILFQVMIPLSLYVTIELVKIGQVYFIQNDVELYHKGTNRRVECRALNITEDLGQVQYIFSDKTGTLTENKMVFKSCTIGGINYSCPSPDESMSESPLNRTVPEQLSRQAYEQDARDPRQSWQEAFSTDPRLHRAVSSMSLSSASGIELEVPIEFRKIQEFFLLMAICNTVVVSQPHKDQMDPTGIVHAETNGHTSRFSVSKIKEKLTSKKPTVPPHLMKSTNQGNGTSIYQTFSDASNHANGYGPGRDETSSTVSEATETSSSVASERIHYEAESPDELALVQAACAYGCRLLRRSPDQVTVWLPGEGEVQIKVLHVLSFDADRKRMSLIVEHPTTKEVVLYCKGADSSISSNLRPMKQGNSHEEFLWETTQKHLTGYAKEGLRTLCMARRIIPEAEYKSWKRLHEEAESTLQDREKSVHESACNIETNLELLGATGIEDRLQDGVPETIAALRNAGISVWVLTGDKQETAINIAYSCRLISYDQEVICLNARNKEMAEDLISNHLEQLDRRLESHDTVSSSPGSPHVEVRSGSLHRHSSRRKMRRKAALVVDGRTLAYAMNDHLKEMFLALAQRCNSVLCCRASPYQKSQVVKLVRDKLKKLTLAIGDGANDVSMIQTADVGVGIAGQEGMQAVMSSDYSLARFRYLQRLLFVHGHWCYDRLARMTLYMWYKNAVFIFVLLWYQLFCGFSGTSPIDDFNLIAFNLLYTSLPPIVLGIFDQDAPASLLMAQPLLYKQGPDGAVYKRFSFFLEVADAIWQSVIQFFIPYLVYQGSHVGIWEFGFTLHAACVYTTLFHICLETKHWNYIHCIVILLCLAGFLGLNVALSVINISVYWVYPHALATPLHWLSILLAVIVSLAPRYVYRSFEGSFFPSEVTVARESERRSLHKEADVPYAMWSSTSSTASVVLERYRSTELTT